jgi:hypothetical protein
MTMGLMVWCFVATDKPRVRGCLCGIHALSGARHHLQGEDLQRRQAEAGRQAAGHLCGKHWSLKETLSG